MIALTLALLCLFTIGAGAAVAHLLPARLALFQMPSVSTASLARPGAALAGASGSPSSLRGGAATAAGVSAVLRGLITSGNLGPHVGALVTDLPTGHVLYALNAAAGFAPASTTKIATAIAALDTLGPGARFTTTVVLRPRQAESRPGGQSSSGGGGSSGGQGKAGGKAATRPARIFLVGGGDPVLAAHRYPPADYPQPATLSALAEQTAKALRARGISQVRLGYDGTRFGGPQVAPGWKPFGTPGNYASSGNVTPITGLELDQGRLTARGAPDDSDDPGNYRPRSLTPTRDAARAFAAFLRKDHITVRGALVPADADGEQQRHRRDSGQAGRRRERPAWHIQGRGGRCYGRRCQTPRDRAPPSRRQRAFAHGQDLAAGAGRPGRPCGHVGPAEPAPGDHRNASGRFFRDPRTRQFLRAVRQDRAWHRPGQDRQPQPRRDLGRSRLYGERSDAGLRLHGEWHLIEVGGAARV